MVVTSDDIRGMDPDEIRETDEAFDIDPDELSFSKFTHHFTVKYRLGALIDRGVLDEEEAERIYQAWNGGESL